MLIRVFKANGFPAVDYVEELAAEAVESYLATVVGLGWVPVAIHEEGRRRGAWFIDDEGNELAIAVSE